MSVCYFILLCMALNCLAEENEMSTVKEIINEHRSLIEKQQNQLEHYHNQLELQQIQLEYQQTQLEQQQTRLEQQQHQLEQQQSQIKHQNITNEKLMIEVDAQRHTIQTLTKRIETLETTSYEKPEKSVARDAVSAPVGFSAYATTLRSYDSGDTVIFDEVISNIGNHYNPENSTFICPYSGLYIFSINFNAHSTYAMYGQIWKDNEYLVEAMAFFNEYSHASAFTVAECNIGQAVRVQCGGIDNFMYGNSGQRSSHFSGALLYTYV